MEKLKRLLIADDNEQYRNTLSRVLKQEYEIDIASNADEEIAKAKQNKYAAIITDNNMEDGHEDSGLYAIGEIRKGGNKTPIILHSAGLSKEKERKAKELGAEVLGKPAELKKLKEMLKSLQS